MAGGVEIPGGNDDVGIHVVSVFMYLSLNRHDLCPLLHQLSRISDKTRNRGRRRDIGASEINLAVHVTHPAYEIAVGSGDGPLSGCKDTHMPAETGSALSLIHI